MEFIYPFFISFMLIFLSELGDKTQLLVLSFSTKDKAKNILLGVAIGTFFSHGLAILFGSKIGSFENKTFQLYSEIFTYASFLLFGLIGFLPKRKESNNDNSKSSIIRKISYIKLNYILVIATSIVIGELGDNYGVKVPYYWGGGHYDGGDKTFLASLGLGLQYPNYRFSLIIGSILGMVASNSVALFFGKILGNKLKPKFVEILSNILFIIFGLFGFINLYF